MLKHLLILHSFRYNIVFLILTYLIPIIVMIFCYSLMGRELWGSRSIGERTERQMESMRSKRKVIWNFSHKKGFKFIHVYCKRWTWTLKGELNFKKNGINCILYIIRIFSIFIEFPKHLWRGFKEDLFHIDIMNFALKAYRYKIYFVYKTLMRGRKISFGDIKKHLRANL